MRGQIPDAACLAGANPDDLLRLASKHTLAACVAYALEASGLASAGTREAIARGMWRTAQLEADWEQARAALEQSGIWNCPLKGAVIKDLYPAPGMRQMADFDVLFDASRADDVRKLMESLGYESHSFGRGVHDVYFRQPVTNLEMHRALFGPNYDARIADFYADVFERLAKDDGNDYGWHMGADETYLYLVAHEHKHFSEGGTGLRSLLDTYVYLCAYGTELDWEWVLANAYALGLGQFEERMRELALRLFADAPLTGEDVRTLEYMFASGTYGTLEHGVRNKVAAHGGGLRGRLGYVRERLFPPMSHVQVYFPFFWEHKALLPLLLPYRLTLAATVHRRRIVVQIRTLASMGLRDGTRETAPAEESR